jgi:hypothetical protein
MLQQAAALLAAGLPLSAAALPPPICGDAPPPAAPGPDQPPLVHTWLLDGPRDAPSPDCSGLRSHDLELLVRVVGSWRAPGGLDDQLTRVGAVSSQTGMLYWSFSDERRQVLVKAAYAVDGAEQRRRRADFSAAELRRAGECLYLEADNRSSSPVLYGLTLLQATPRAFTVRVENLDEIRTMGLLLVAPREMQWLLTVEQLGPGLWGYRSLQGLRALRLGFNAQHRRSNLSRSVAMFDHLTGRQTDVAPYR